MKKNYYLSCIFILLTWIGFSQNAYNVDLSVFTTSTNGYNSDGFDGVVNKSVLQSDGKIICVGDFQTYRGVSTPRIVRLLANGDIDPSFTIGTGFNTEVKGAYVESNGKIIVYGRFNIFNGSIIKRGICRLNANGTFDTSMPNTVNGGLAFTIGSGQSINDVEVLPNGNIVAVGNFTSYDNVTVPPIVVLTPAGVYDPSLNTGNFGTITGSISAIEKDASNRLVVAGNFDISIFGVSVKGVARFSSNLTFDTSFLSNGNGDFYKLNNQASDVKILSDGSMIVSGTFTTLSGLSNTYPNFIKVTSAGNLDASFTYPTFPTSANYTGTKVAFHTQVDANNKLLIAYSVSNNTYFHILRCNSNGTSPTFYNEVVKNGLLTHITPLSTGKYLLAGEYRSFNGKYLNRFGRVNNDLTTIDQTFSNHKGIGLGEVRAILQLSDGKTLVGGTFVGYDNRIVSNLVQFHADGSLDTTFITPVTEDVYSIAQTGSLILVGTKGVLHGLNMDGTTRLAFQKGTFNNGRVLTILPFSDRIYIGGDFCNYKAGNTTSSKCNFAVLSNPSTGSIIGSFNNYSGLPEFNNTVNVIKLVNLDIYVGGVFTTAAGNGVTYSIRGLAQLNQSGLLTWNNASKPGFGIVANNGNVEVYDIESLSSTQILVAGKFNSYTYNNTTVVPCHGLMLFDNTLMPASTYTNFNTRLAQYDIVYDISKNGNDMLLALASVAGYQGTASAKRIAMINLTGVLNTSFHNQFTNAALGDVKVFSNVVGTTFYVGGNFTSMFEKDRKRIARLAYGPASPSIPSPQQVCSTGNPLISSLNMGGYTNLRFYSTPTGGTQLSQLVPLSNTTYYVADVVSSVESPVRTPVQVSLVNQFIKYDTVNSCGAYTWVRGNGLTYTSNTTSPYPSKTIVNANTCDSLLYLVLKIKPNTTSSSAHTACVTYTWPLNGQTYTTSGAKTHIIPNAAGCDSIITLNLTIKSPTTAVVNRTACITYTWPLNGTTYTTSGTRTHTLQNAAGCDSVVTLNLTIKTPTSATVNHSACVTYTWPLNGTTYTTSGTRTHTIQNVAGCDSVVTLNLTIKTPTASTVTQSACGTYTWPLNGATYTTSGTRTHTIQNAAGCDSVVTLNLTIKTATSATVTLSGCGTYTWPLNGQTYTTSGTRIHTIQNAAGCDSVVTLNLTIKNPTTAQVSHATCNSTYTWTLNGQTYTQGGTYTAQLTNVAGCDSVVTLNLVFKTATSATVNHTTCDPSYTWPLNGQTYTASTTASHTLVNVAGCDSVVTLNLTLGAQPTRLVQVTTCSSFTWSYNPNMTYSTPGSYTASATVQMPNGCDSIISLQLNYLAISTVNISVTGLTLAVDQSGDTYQWIDCDNNNASIPGANSPTFTPSANGNYAVTVTLGNCSWTSSCYFFNKLGLDDLETRSLDLYPNPTHDQVNLVFNTVNEFIHVQVIDVAGRLVQEQTVLENDRLLISLHGERGVYSFLITTSEGSTVRKVVLQ